MPCCFDVALDPLFDLGNVFFGVVEVFADIVGLAAGHEASGRCFAGLLLDRPAAVLDTRGEMAGPTVGLSVCEVEILGVSGGVIGVVSKEILLGRYHFSTYGEGVDLRMHSCYFPGICIHASSSFAGFDIAPDHGRHVTLIVHEASVKVGRFIWIWRYNVGAATREGVLQKVEHGEELAWWYQHVVAKEARSRISLLRVQLHE